MKRLAACPANRTHRGWIDACVVACLLGAAAIFGGRAVWNSGWLTPPTPTSHAPTPATASRSAGPVPGEVTATNAPSERVLIVGDAADGTPLVTQPIETLRVGQRIAGRNPIREQAELIEPDPATWRQINLSMTKDSGQGLWIELLRPLTWIEAAGARPGQSIHLNLFEMGAEGDAEVTYVGPCPPIEPGPGTVVTGTFQHQVDATSTVVHLRLEGQAEATGVTDNHPYWSEDRQDFIPAGQLRAGERVDTHHGLTRVVSVTPIAHRGFLYNRETTEHVYRVGTLGTLVHNNCAVAR